MEVTVKEIDFLDVITWILACAILAAVGAAVTYVLFGAVTIHNDYTIQTYGVHYLFWFVSVSVFAFVGRIFDEK
jgi:hypothetical protein